MVSLCALVRFEGAVYLVPQSGGWVDLVVRICVITVTTLLGLMDGGLGIRCKQRFGQWVDRLSALPSELARKPQVVRQVLPDLLWDSWADRFRRLGSAPPGARAA